MPEPSKEVYELQYMLRKIAQVTGEIPLINHDGIYGEDTRAAVRAFQAQNGLPANGEVNKQVWDAIFEKYKESVYLTSRPEPIYPFSTSYATVPGEKSDIIVLIQLILSALAVVYDDFEDVVITGEKDDATVEALKRFQGYNGLPRTGVLDRRTWDAAAKSFNAYYNNSNYTA